MRAIDALSTRRSPTIREGDEPRMTIELALLRVARPQLDPSREALAQRLERLEQRAGAAERLRPAAAEAPRRAGSAEPPARPRQPRAEAAREAGRASRGPRRAKSASSSRRRRTVAMRIDLERVVGLWPAVIDQVRKSGLGAALDALFEGARPIAVDAEQPVLQVGFPPSAPVQQAQGRGARRTASASPTPSRRSSASGCGRSTCCSRARTSAGAEPRD